MSQSELKEYTWKEISEHDKDTDCWVVLYDKVLDVTSWLNEHPGGLDSIKDMGGMDITSSFESVGHTSTALLKSKTFIIGRVDPKSERVTGAAKVTAPRPKWSEMSPEELRKYEAGGDIIPLWALISGAVMALALLYYIFLRVTS